MHSDSSTHVIHLLQNIITQSSKIQVNLITEYRLVVEDALLKWFDFDFVGFEPVSLS